MPAQPAKAAASIKAEHFTTGKFGGSDFMIFCLLMGWVVNIFEVTPGY
jgi:hypothetical protein